MSKFRSSIDLQLNELRNAVIQNLQSSPSASSEGQIYYDRGKHAVYVWNGTNWIELGAGSAPVSSDVRQFFLNLPFPRGNEDFALVRLCEPIQVLRIDAAINTNETLGFHVLSKTNLSDAGTPLTETPIVAVIGGVAVGRFTNANCPADNWLVFKTMSLSGDVAMFTLTITCRAMPSSGTEH